MTSLSQTDPAALQPVIRRAHPADAAALAEIGRATFTETFGHLYPPEDLQTFLDLSHSDARARADLADPAQAVWLAQSQGRTLGYALAGPCGLPHPEAEPCDGELKRLYLLGSAQNLGLGKRLMDAAVGWLEADGPRTLWLGVWEKNVGAQKFYRRWGFIAVGAYDFHVGASVDHELILRRSREHYSSKRESTTGATHDST